MRYIIISIIFWLFLYSCSNIRDGIFSSKNKLKTTNVEFSVTCDSVNGIVEVYTETFKRDEKIIYEKENRSEISLETEYYVRLSQQSMEMIEKDGGIDNLMKILLSRENYEILGDRYSLPFKVTMYLDGRSVTGYSFSIRPWNRKLLKLTHEEIDKIYSYFSKVIFIYSGNKFKDEIVPVGYTFVVRK